MNISLVKPLLILTSIILLSACSVAKLEARLEANPQCRDVVNPKTGALMPCPGSDKAFYREVGLAPAKSAANVNSQVNTQATSESVTIVAPTTTANSSSMTTSIATSPAKTAVPVDCKPQIHKKTGGTLPCPAPD